MTKDNQGNGFFQRDAPLVGEGEIFASLAENRGSSLFLGRFSMTEVLAVMNKRSFLRDARKRGFLPLEFELDSSGHPLQRLTIYSRSAKPENMIVDLKIKEGDYAPKSADLPGFPRGQQKCLFLEWLTLQNPNLAFSGKTSPLPGQMYPGLNLSKKIMDIFIYLARLIHKDGLLAFPAYFHNALLFSRYFRFVNPEKEGEVRAVRAFFSHVPFKQLAWIVHFGSLKNAEGTPLEWKSEEQMFALSRPLRDYFDSRGYKERVKSAMKGRGFVVDWDAFNKKSRELPLCGQGFF